MRCKFIQEYATKVSYEYEIEIDDDVKITLDEYGDYYVDGVELYSIIEKIQESNDPKIVKLGGVTLLNENSKEKEKMISSAQYLLKEEGENTK